MAIIMIVGSISPQHNLHRLLDTTTVNIEFMLRHLLHNIESQLGRQPRNVVAERLRHIVVSRAPKQQSGNQDNRRRNVSVKLVCWAVVARMMGNDEDDGDDDDADSDRDHINDGYAEEAEEEDMY